MVRLLIWPTIEHPVVGIPVDIAIAGFVVYRFSRSGKSAAEGFSSNNGTGLGLDVSDSRADVNREFAQLRKFDPNFSEIVFTDFCYALYGKAHDARGRGAKALDQFSPYLSEAARKSLLQRNPSGLREVKGIIIGG